MLKSIAILSALILFGAGATLFLKRPHSPSEGAVATSTTSSQTSRVTNARAAPEGSREYRSTAYHFSLLYPKELKVTEHAEGGGAMTVTFQDINTVQGFQIFVVPYTESQVSETRFKMDEPSGVRKDVTNITIDGAVAAAFSSTNSALGETREFWFIHNGYLYEVTTLKPLDAWLGAILATWKFM